MDAESLTFNFVNRLIRLTPLSPTVQEAIPEGRQRKAIRLVELARTIPMAWDELRDLVKS